MEQLSSNSDPVKKRRSLSRNRSMRFSLKPAGEMFPLHRCCGNGAFIPRI